MVTRLANAYAYAIMRTHTPSSTNFSYFLFTLHMSVVCIVAFLSTLHTSQRFHCMRFNRFGRSINKKRELFCSICIACESHIAIEYWQDTLHIRFHIDCNSKKKKSNIQRPLFWNMQKRIRYICIYEVAFDDIHK